MPEITEQIHKLIEGGQTEQALETLANWLRTQQTTSLNEVILLRSRYEQVERDLGLNLISAAEAARSFSQINYALLNLLQNINNPVITTPTSTKRSGWLIAGAGAVLLLVLIMFVFKVLFPSRELSTIGESAQISEKETTERLHPAVTNKKVAMIQFPQGQKVSLVVVDTKVTYTVLEGQVEPYNVENQKLNLKIRALLHEGRGGMNFWDSNFRVIVNDLPYAGQGGLNEVVENDSFKDGEIFFIIPKNTRKADLKLTFYKESAILPMEW